MKIFKNIKNIEVYKFGVISTVLYEPGIRQNEYFRKLSKQGIDIPPGKDYIKSEEICYETLRKYVNDHGLLTKEVRVERKKFEKEFVNELWMVDFKEGKSIIAAGSHLAVQHLLNKRG